MDRATFLSGATSAIAVLAPSTNSFAALEARYGGRLGVAAVHARTGERIVHRAGERFPMCSTFKVLLAAAVLSRVDAGRDRLERRIAYTRADLLPYAPIARTHVARGAMSLAALCEAAIVYSDNTAANLLLRAVGGPARVTAFARTLGDSHTRLDRDEPALNTAIPGDPRDTTTPAATAENLQKLFLGNALAPGSRRALRSWMAACTTGSDCIRAGVPKGWVVGDKTGSGANATRNDIAVLEPPRGAPIFVTAYYTGSSAGEAARDDVLAEVGRTVSSRLG